MMRIQDSDSIKSWGKNYGPSTKTSFYPFNERVPISGSKEFSVENESQRTVSTPGKGYIRKINISREKATGVSPMHIRNNDTPSVSPRYSEDEEELQQAFINF